MAATLEQKKVANREYQRQYRKRHPEKVANAQRERNRRWRKLNPEYARTYDETHKEQKRRRNCRYYELYPDKWRAVKYKHNFGITIEDYERLLIKQHGVCAICGDTPRDRRLCVDHDHDTGEIRGLLCWLCNLAIGCMADKPDRLHKAAQYLENQ